MYTGSLPAVSNKATYTQSFQVNDSETGALVDLSAATIVFAVRGKNGGSVVLTATNSDGIDMADAADGVFEVEFTDTQMRTLCDREYDVGCTIEISDNVTQYIIGTLPVLDGIVT
jgi:predicted NUDIX family NTP pyrophosphohydrolase